MNVLLVIPTLGHGGAQRVVVELARYLSVFADKDGAIRSPAHTSFNVSILTFADKTAIPYFYSPPAGVCSLSTFSYSAEGLSIKKLAMLPFQLRRIIKRQNIEVVVSFQDIANFPVILATRFYKVGVIVSERQDTRFYNFTLVRKVLRSLLYAKADFTVVQTELIKNQMPSSAVVKVIPNACPQFTATAKPALPDRNQFRAVVVGRLESQKNLEFLIRASVVILASCKDWIIEVFGSGSLHSMLQEQINKKNLQDHVFLRGPISNVEEVLTTRNLFLFPSLYEGFPNALAEAVSAGLPAIAFEDVSGVAELIETMKSGILLPRTNSAELEFAEAAILLMNDHKLREVMGRRSLARSLNYRPRRIYGTWREIILSSSDH